MEITSEKEATILNKTGYTLEQILKMTDAYFNFYVYLGLCKNQHKITEEQVDWLFKLRSSPQRQDIKKVFEV